MLSYLYHELKWHELAHRKDIFNIAQKEEKLKNLDKVIYESADEVGRLNSIKMQLERDVEGQINRIDHYDSVLIKKYQASIED